MINYMSIFIQVIIGEWIEKLASQDLGMDPRNSFMDVLMSLFMQTMVNSIQIYIMNRLANYF